MLIRTVEDAYIAHPIDIAEEMANLNKWELVRDRDDEISIQITGQWGDYAVGLSTSEFIDTLIASCSFDFEASGDRTAELRILKGVIDAATVGKVILNTEYGMVSFRRDQDLPEDTDTESDLIARLIGSTVSAVDLYYPAFQSVGAGEATEKALELAFNPRIGHA